MTRLNEFDPNEFHRILDQMAADVILIKKNLGWNATRLADEMCKASEEEINFTTLRPVISIILRDGDDAWRTKVESRIGLKGLRRACQAVETFKSKHVSTIVEGPVPDLSNEDEATQARFCLKLALEELSGKNLIQDRLKALRMFGGYVSQARDLSTPGVEEWRSVMCRDALAIATDLLQPVLPGLVDEGDLDCNRLISWFTNLLDTGRSHLSHFNDRVEGMIQGTKVDVEAGLPSYAGFCLVRVGLLSNNQESIEQGWNLQMKSLVPNTVLEARIGHNAVDSLDALLANTYHDADLWVKQLIGTIRKEALDRALEDLDVPEFRNYLDQINFYKKGA